jgi:hypothetical protein
VARRAGTKAAKAATRNEPGSKANEQSDFRLRFTIYDSTGIGSRWEIETRLKYSLTQGRILLRIIWQEVCVIIPLWILGALLTGGAIRNSQLTAAVIMSRVAANQDRSNQLRNDYVYHQRVRVAARKSNGRLMCEETFDYRIIPSSDSTKKDLQELSGRYWHKGRYVDFHQKLHGDDESIDCDVVDALGEGLTSDHSRDGIAKELFPLTSEQQKNDRFKLLDKQNLQGRRVYRISFMPTNRKEFKWAGEAYVDVNDFQPVDVFTNPSRQIPLVVRAFLLALPGVGFNVQYQRQPDGVWFPSSFGTEFRVRFLMFYRREYTISLENTAFQHTRVTSKMHYAGPVRPK